MAPPIPSPDPTTLDKIRELLNQRLTLDLLFVAIGAGLWRRGFRDRSLIDKGMEGENARLSKRVNDLEDRVDEVEKRGIERERAAEERFNNRIAAMEAVIHEKDTEISRLTEALSSQTIINDGLMRENEQLLRKVETQEGVKSR